MHDGLWNWKFAKLSIAFIFLELKFAIFAIQVFWYWSENCPLQTEKGLQRLRILRTGGSPTLYGVLNIFEFLYFLILFLFLLLFLFYSILFYSILFYSILFYSILFYSILFYSILFYLSPHGINCNIYFFVSEKVYFKSYIIWGTVEPRGISMIKATHLSRYLK